MKWIVLLLMLFGSAAFAQDPFEDPTEIYVDGSGSAAGDLKLDVGEKLIFDDDQEESDYITAASNNIIDIYNNATLRARWNNSSMQLYSADFFLGTAGKRFYNSVEVLSLGSAGTTSHELVTGDVIFGAGAAVEFDDTAWFDGAAYFTNVNVIYDNVFTKMGTSLDAGYLWSTYNSNNAFVFYTDVNNAAYSGNFIFTKKSNSAKDHDHGTSVDPKWILHSATDPDSDNTQWISMTHDQTNGVIDVGTGYIQMSDTTEFLSHAVHGDNDRVYLGGGLDAGIQWFVGASNPDAMYIYTNTNNDEYSGNIIITEDSNITKIHDHAATVNPKLIIHSATDPDSDNTQWLSLIHDQTNGVIDVGTGVIDMKDAVKIDDQVHATAWTEPAVCGASTLGLMQMIDDSNDTGWSVMCVCANLDGTGYDWRDLSDIAGTACPFF